MHIQAVLMPSNKILRKLPDSNKMARVDACTARYSGVRCMLSTPCMGTCDLPDGRVSGVVKFVSGYVSKCHMDTLTVTTCHSVSNLRKP